MLRIKFHLNEDYDGLQVDELIGLETNWRFCAELHFKYDFRNNCNYG